MAWTLAITGKGGAGKTTLAAFAVRWLVENRRLNVAQASSLHSSRQDACATSGPVLAVDADPNTCLDALLGVKAACSVGSVREEAKRIVQAEKDSAGGLSKHELLDLKIQQALVEGASFDLIAMGRPEGPGCYCYANNVLRQVLARLAAQYASVVIDNEAGLENLSRRTVQQTDWLIFVSDPSARGLTTARRLYDLSREMEVAAQRVGVVVNRMRDSGCLDRARELFAATPVEILGGIPEDSAIAAQDAAGAPVFALPAHNPALVAAMEILQRLSAPETRNQELETRNHEPTTV